jgi:hypothetical protein
MRPFTTFLMICLLPLIAVCQPNVDNDCTFEIDGNYLIINHMSTIDLSEYMEPPVEPPVEPPIEPPPPTDYAGGFGLLSSYNLPNVAYVALDTDDVSDSDIVCTAGATATKSIARNAIVFSVPPGQFGLMYLCDNLNKSKISCLYSFGVETSGTHFAVFNRAEYNKQTFVEGLVQPSISNVMMEKVYPPSNDVVIAYDNNTINMPIQITSFETYFDLDNNICCVRKSNSPDSSSGIVSSAIGDFGGVGVFNNMMIGFQNTGSQTQTAIIYLPIIITTD